MVYELRKKAEEELLNHIAPFWLKLIDNENGGFYGEVSYDLKINKESVKGGIQTSRILWFFSARIVQQRMKNIRRLQPYL